MKAVVQDRYGSADTLEFTDVDRPVPGAGEVLPRDLHGLGVPGGAPPHPVRVEGLDARPGA
ncbi:hypothetical protein ACWDRX_36185, partial [Streptomyces nigra]